ncbi:hypothetical protein [Paraburkholderia sp. 40]
MSLEGRLLPVGLRHMSAMKRHSPAPALGHWDVGYTREAAVGHRPSA